MTVQKAERITGMRVSVRRMTTGTYECSLFEAQEKDFPIVSGQGRTYPEAISRAIEANYRRISTRVMKEQGYACFVCGKLRPLQIDHIHARSTHGRNDRRENLRAVCADCHHKITNHILKSPEPHRSVLRFTVPGGLDWNGDLQQWQTIQR
jgi:hypothetical protein